VAQPIEKISTFASAFEMSPRLTPLSWKGYPPPRKKDSARHIPVSGVYRNIASKTGFSHVPQGERRCEVVENIISNAKNEEGTLVFCMYIVRNGKRIYRKNGRQFCFRVK
jgi:hypothetical protein